MKVAVLGLGVIGTTYAYALQKAGCDTYHIVREGKVIPPVIPVKNTLSIFDAPDLQTPTQRRFRRFSERSSRRSAVFVAKEPLLL